jgi:hypothetical protein
MRSFPNTQANLFLCETYRNDLREFAPHHLMIKAIK